MRENREDNFMATVNRMILFYDKLGVLKKRLFFHVQNEGSGDIIRGVRNKRCGVREGVPDFIYLHPSSDRKYSGLCMELKIGNKPLSKKQKEFEEELDKEIYLYTVVRTLAQAEDVITSYCGYKKEEKI